MQQFAIILSLLNSSPSQMRQELIKEARSQRSDFDLNAHDEEGISASLAEVGSKKFGTHCCNFLQIEESAEFGKT